MRCRCLSVSVSLLSLFPESSESAVCVGVWVSLLLLRAGCCCGRSAERTPSIKVHVSPSLQEMPCPSPCNIPLNVLPSTVPVQVRLATSTWNLENNEHMWPCIVTSLLLPARQMPSNWLRVCSGDLLTGRFSATHRAPVGLSGSDDDMSLDACTGNSYHTKYARPE